MANQKDDLYFMRIIGGPVKIGRAKDVDRRLGAVQIGCPQDIDEVLSLPGRGHEERQWHQHFAELRIMGEWFRWSPELGAAVKRAGGGRSWKRRPHVPSEAEEQLYKETFGFTYTELRERKAGEV